ncbi:MAG TPA: nitrilase-related carbon-nitrogen hydrolase [Ktedonobacterales bacterium]|nr:nitrilase-related carbon-nitrogen hydrolase [Ktedonobacterales bacterium]
MNTLSIALVQMRCEKGAIDANLAAIQGYLQEAISRNVEIICFPEMSITGYIDPTRQPEAIARLDGPEVARFVAMTGGTAITAIAGIVEANPNGKPFITQIVARNGQLLDYYRKKTIITDEVAWFAPGAATTVFTHPKAACGLAICADIENPEVFAANAAQGARIIFEAAAPGLYGEQATRNWQTGYNWWHGECHVKLGQYAHDHQVYIAVATQAGRTSDEDFPGGGYVFGPDGTCLHETPDWSENVLYAQLPL